MTYHTVEGAQVFIDDARAYKRLANGSRVCHSVRGERQRLGRHAAPRRRTGPVRTAQAQVAEPVGLYTIHHTDALAWLAAADENSIHAVVTDPPYGVVEYTPAQLAKRRNGHGGVWRIPPAFDGATRQPVPRFTALTQSDREVVRSFFAMFAERLLPILVPGAHVFVATTPVISHLVYEPFIKRGFREAR